MTRYLRLLLAEGKQSFCSSTEPRVTVPPFLASEVIASHHRCSQCTWAGLDAVVLAVCTVARALELISLFSPC